MTPAAILVVFAMVGGHAQWGYKFYKTEAECREIATQLNTSDKPVAATCIPDREI